LNSQYFVPERIRFTKFIFLNFSRSISYPSYRWIPISTGDDEDEEIPISRTILKSMKCLIL
jgi:hypothetical protein